MGDALGLLAGHWWFVPSACASPVERDADEFLRRAQVLLDGGLEEGTWEWRAELARDAEDPVRSSSAASHAPLTR
jgi:hypothetical protein